MSSAATALESVLASVAQAVIGVDPQGRIAFCNLPTARMFGYSLEEMSGLPIDLLVPERFRAVHAARRTIYSARPHHRPMGRGIELTARRKDGSEFKVEISLNPMEDFIIVCLTDTAERERLEQDLRERDLFFRLAADMLSVGHADGRLMQVSPSFERHLGWPLEEYVTGNFVERFVEPEDRERLLLALREGETVRVRCACADGGERWLEWSATCAVAGSDAIYSVARDVSVEVRAEQERRRLTAQLLAAQEEERRRLALEFHDDIAQRLSVIGIEIGLLRQRLPEPGLVKIQEQVADLTDQVRHLSHGLHPSVLEHCGLSGALQQHCDEVAVQSGLRITCRIRKGVPVKLPIDLATVAYRIVQESLRNVVRHALAKSAYVTLWAGPGELLVSVMDDGCGFDVAAVRTVPGIGLDAIRERARMAGGEASILSEPGEGTRVEVRLPLTPAAVGGECPVTV